MSKQPSEFELLLKTSSKMEEDKGLDPFKKSQKTPTSPPPVVTTTAEQSAASVTTPTTTVGTTPTESTSSDAVTTPISTPPPAPYFDTSNFAKEDSKRRQQEFKTRCGQLPALRRKFDTACTNVEDFLSQNVSQSKVFPILDQACRAFEDLRKLRLYCEEPLTAMEKRTKRDYIGEITNKVDQIMNAYEKKFGSTILEEDEEEDLLGGATGFTPSQQPLQTQQSQQPPQLRRPNIMESTHIDDPSLKLGARRKIFSPTLDMGTNDQEEDIDNNLQRRLENLSISVNNPVNGSASLNMDPRDTYIRNLEKKNATLESQLSHQESRLDRLERSMNNSTLESSANVLATLQESVSKSVSGLSHTFTVANFKISDEVNIIFKGNPSDYFIWLNQWNRAYAKMKNECNWDNVKIFLELVKVCSGRALDMIKGLTSSPHDGSLAIALNTLERMYGNKFGVVQDLIKQVMGLKDMDDSAKSLEDGFALANNLWQQFETLNLTSEDQSSLFFISILELHLSKSASMEWQKLLYARQNPDSVLGADVSAQDMLDILEKCSNFQKGLDNQRKFNQSLGGQNQRANQNSQSSSGRNHRAQPLSIGILRTKADEISLAELRKHNTCIICDGKQDHKETLKCPLLKTISKKDLTERLTLYKACSKCLRAGRPHSKEHPCKLSDCNLGNCNGRHARLLHRHFVYQPQQARSNSTQSTPSNSAPPTPSKDKDNKDSK